MSAYVIVNIGPEEPEGLSGYLHNVSAFIGKYAGKQILDKGKLIRFDGIKDHNKYLVLEFDSLIHAKKFWESEENAPLKSFEELTGFNTTFIQGVNNPYLMNNYQFI